MRITKFAEAGSISTGDILISVEPNPEHGVKIKLTGKNVVIKQFGRQIEETIRNTLSELCVDDIVLSANDNGSLDYVIRARVIGAILRAV